MVKWQLSKWGICWPESANSSMSLVFCFFLIFCWPPVSFYLITGSSLFCQSNSSPLKLSSDLWNSLQWFKVNCKFKMHKRELHSLVWQNVRIIINAYIKLIISDDRLQNLGWFPTLGWILQARKRPSVIPLSYTTTKSLHFRLLLEEFQMEINIRLTVIMENMNGTC